MRTERNTFHLCPWSYPYAHAVFNVHISKIHLHLFSFKAYKLCSYCLTFMALIKWILEYICLMSVICYCLYNFATNFYYACRIIFTYRPSFCRGKIHCGKIRNIVQGPSRFPTGSVSPPSRVHHTDQVMEISLSWVCKWGLGGGMSPLDAQSQTVKTSATEWLSQRSNKQLLT